MSEFGARPKSSFGRYQLLLEMARGGMATLYLARLQGPKSFEKLIVVKRIHDHYAHEESFIQMFLDEARITAAIGHPNVASVFDMGEQDGSYYLAMEYVHGQNLKDLLKAASRSEGALHWSMVCRVVADAAAGLHAAHELTGAEGTPLGVVHRDVSPQNLLVSYDGNVKVVDFGIAYAAERLATTAAGTVKGKAAYMSPEQVDARPVDRRSDIFALGIVLWEGICMRRLFRADTEAATLLRVRDAVVPPPLEVDPALPPELEQITLRALAKEPEDRFATGAELEDALNQLLVQQGHHVGRQQIQTTMDLLFHDRRKIKDEQIQRAMAEEATSPPVAVGMGADKYSSSSTSLAVSAAMEKEQIFGPSRLTYLIGGLAVLGVVGLLLLLLFGGDGGEADSDRRAEAEGAPSHARTAPRRRAAGPPPDARGDDAKAPRRRASRRPMSQMVTLKVTVLPDEAEPVVVFRGKKYKGSEFRVLVRRSVGEELIEIRAPGYRKETVLLTPTQSVSTKVTLKPEARTAPRRRYRWRPPMRRRPMSLYLDLPE
jgi:serine/threonine-protein kinase